VLVDNMANTSVDLALIHRLTNLSDINRLLHETVAKERAIDSELDQLLSKRADLERSFLLLNTPTAEVGHAQSLRLFQCPQAYPCMLSTSTDTRPSV